MRKLQALNSSAPSQNIKIRTSGVAVFSKTFLPSAPIEITFEISFNLVRRYLVENI